MAEFFKGDLVQVLDVEDKRDLRAGGQPTSTEKFIGRVGRIVEVDTGKAPMPVGNCALDPLYIVEVPVLGKDGFWAEELKKL